MGALPQVGLRLAGASWLLTQGGSDSCSSEAAALGLGAFAPSSVYGAGGGLEDAAPCSHFLISIFCLRCYFSLIIACARCEKC